MCRARSWFTQPFLFCDFFDSVANTVKIQPDQEFSQIFISPEEWMGRRALPAEPRQGVFVVLWLHLFCHSVTKLTLKTKKFWYLHQPFSVQTPGDSILFLLGEAVKVLSCLCEQQQWLCCTEHCVLSVINPLLCSLHSSFCPFPVHSFQCFGTSGYLSWRTVSGFQAQTAAARKNKLAFSAPPEQL